MTNSTRTLTTATTVAYVDAQGNTVLLVDRATGRVLYRAA